MGLFDKMLDVIVEGSSTVVSGVIAAPFTVAQKSVELVEKTVEKTGKAIEKATKNI